MTKYEVQIPFAGYVVMTVEADSEADAIDKAFGAELTMKPDVDVVQPEGVSDVSAEEWSFFEVITEGNVFHGPLNRASAEEIEE